MGEEVKTPGQVAYEEAPVMFIDPWEGPEMWVRLSGNMRQDWEAAAQAVLDADPVRTQALALVESLARELGRHMALTTEEDVLIEHAFEFVRKAREASKP